jgi:TatD DNase family protein
MLIDTHTYLDAAEFTKDLDDALLRAKQADVQCIVTVGRDLESSRKAVQLAERYPQVYASVGIHPNRANQEREDFLLELEQLLKHPKVVAIGAVGLDYSRLTSKQENDEVIEGALGAADFHTIEAEIRDEAELAAQSSTFEQQLELAAPTGKGVVIHQCDAWEDTIELLRKYSARTRAVMHGFDGGPDRAEELLDLAHFISFTGNVAFKKASELQKAVKLVRIDRIMVESGAPYSASAATRNRRNELAFVRETAEFIAALRGMSLAAFSAQTAQNAQQFFTMS